MIQYLEFMIREPNAVGFLTRDGARFSQIIDDVVDYFKLNAQCSLQIIHELSNIHGFKLVSHSGDSYILSRNI